MQKHLFMTPTQALENLSIKGGKAFKSVTGYLFKDYGKDREVHRLE
ncbi:MAG: hypothetical protein ACI86M_000736 [Saprospiraceae bacterium]|jgi:hypothetical protein